MATTESTEPISDDERRVRAQSHDFDEPSFLLALDEAAAALDEAGVPFLFMGGIASACQGRPRFTHDIDLFVRPQEARKALDALANNGFETEETYAEWLYKGFKHDQMVDVIFRSSGDIYLDDEMLARAPVTDFMGRDVRIVPAEDLIVIKAVVHNEHMPRHWHDALALIAVADLDWEYLVRRARKGVRRVLALLLYAQSNDLVVPWGPVRELFGLIDDPHAHPLRVTA
ncbi:MAG TPA: nucleotidyl transferase AbiEii/AbiGii toxin family protein [Acidimicrobiales bacterium]|jgi:predicted nucleotidyltransferase|nr:nucleotidyl transferase AbiEii/AbiGii toxin family protein [Acidimicrobiales bacterium]